MVCAHNTPFLRYLGLTCLSASFCGATQYGVESFLNYVRPSQRLAVVIPFYRGDLSRTVSSLGRWPINCSPVTLHNIDLVLYYAEAGDDDNLTVESAADAISASAGRCFAKTRTVYASLGEGVSSFSFVDKASERASAWFRGRGGRVTVRFYDCFDEATARDQVVSRGYTINDVLYI